MKGKEYKPPTLDNLEVVNDVPDGYVKMDNGKLRKLFNSGLSDIVSHDPAEISTWAPIDFVNSIDAAFECIRAYSLNHRRKLSPQMWYYLWFDLDIEFGAWSNLINLEMREMMKITSNKIVDKKNTDENQDLHNKFSWAYAYWWNRCSYINTCLKSTSGLGGLTQKKNIEKARKALKDLILGNLVEKDMTDTFRRLVLDIKLGKINNRK